MTNQQQLTSPSKNESGQDHAARGRHSVHLGLGSNLGRRRKHLKSALEHIECMEGCRLVECSSLYETEPEGAGSNWYLNLVARIETTLAPHHLLNQLLALEKHLGRDRTRDWPDRTLDIDILLWEDTILRDRDLQIPHPRMHRRRFVLVPLAELDPKTQHPLLHRSVAELLAEAPAARILPQGRLDEI